MADMQTSGQVTGIMGIRENLEGRHVLLVEDIVDTGITATHLIKKSTIIILHH
jgi:hypoxanthine phosphoribosyltransferase